MTNRKKLREGEDLSQGPLLGSHVSTSGGFTKALERAAMIGCQAMQVFVKQNTRWQWPEPKAEDLAGFHAQLPQTPVRAMLAHTIYLVNLASQNPEFLRKSIEDMIDELGRCDALGIPSLVLHPGAHGGAGLEAGISRVAASLDEIFSTLPKSRCRVLLETTSGQGTSVGGRFEHLGEIIRRVRHKRRVGVCLDTCHVFAAGYDFRTRESYEALWSEFDRTIGLKKLHGIHLNDSKKPLGSHADRHEHIGKGELGLEAFRLLVNDPRLRLVPMVLETEKDPDMKHDIENLRVLRSLVVRQD